MSSFLKNSITFLGLLLIVALGYYLFVIKGSSTLQSVTLAGQADAEIQNYLTRLEQLQSLQLDTSILTNGYLSGLVDNSTPVPAEPVGRDNPFAPVD